MQTLANNESSFKEEFMQGMNPFLADNSAKIKDFYLRLVVNNII